MPDWHKAIDGVRLALDHAPEMSLERCLADIVVGILVAGEMKVRAGLLRAHTHRVEHKAYVVRGFSAGEMRPSARKKSGRLRIEQASIDKLIDDAAALRMATDIRTYIEAVRFANRDSPEPVSAEQMAEWAG
jgi:hypothetical protein